MAPAVSSRRSWLCLSTLVALGPAGSPQVSGKRSAPAGPPLVRNLQLNGVLIPPGDIANPAVASRTPFLVSPDRSRVVYLADQEVDEQYELYSVPLNGSADPVRLSGALPPGGDVTTYAISPDNRWVIFRADQDTDQAFELYSSPLEGSQGSLKLNDPLGPGGFVGTSFEISADGRYVVYGATEARADLYSVPPEGGTGPIRLTPAGLFIGNNGLCFKVAPDGKRVVFNIIGGDLFSVRINGFGSPIQLNDAPVPGGAVLSFEISPDSSRVVFTGHLDTVGTIELYSVPIDASSPQTKLSGTMVLGGGVLQIAEPQFRISPDSNRVVYVADQDTDEVFELYSVPVDGNQAPTKVHPTFGSNADIQKNVFAISPDSTRIVYVADQDTDEVLEIYSTALDGGQSPVKLNGPLVAGGDVAQDLSRDLVIAADSSRIVYRADQDQNEVFELYSARLDGGGSPLKLNPPLAVGGDVAADFAIDPQSRNAVYRADQDTNDVFELFRVRLNGSGTALKLNPTLVSGGDVLRDFTIPDPGIVIYRADQEQAGVDELFASIFDRGLSKRDPIRRP